MAIRDRVRELRRVPACELRSHPLNFRRHPVAQRAALRGVLDEIGFAGALLAFELHDGTLQLIDGHLRADVVPDTPLPVLVLDVSEQEAEKILLSFDPLSQLATNDQDRLAELFGRVEFESQAVGSFLEQASQNLCGPFDEPGSGVDRSIPTAYQIVVDCTDESQQAALYERLRREGYPCRVLTLL